MKDNNVSPLKKVHFIAIGGSAMHNLAIALKQNEINVTGSDDEIYEPSYSILAANNLLPELIGWFPEKITEDIDAIVLGMHARADNPELIKAQLLGIRIYSYPEFIYEQCRNKQRVIVAGSHGKTTTTAMILHVLKYHNRNFDYMVGAKIEGFDNMVKLSDDAPVVILEGDEYLSSPIDRQPKFLHYHYHIALITGIAWDHINVFPTFKEYCLQFEKLVAQSPKSGVLIYDETDEMLTNICQQNKEIDVQKIRYGVYNHVVKEGKTYLLTAQKEAVALQIFGEHNLKNLAGAKLVLEQIGITEEMFCQAIPSFKGAKNRLEVIKSNMNTIVFRDFAHAPSKLKATTQAVKQQFPSQKLVACMELHTFSSLTKDFLIEYAHSLDSCDVAVVFYSPHTIAHKRLPPISIDDVRNAFGRQDLWVFTDTDALEVFLKQQSRENTNLLLMSSGTFGGLPIKNLL